jgi:hypothetical protein
MKPIVITTSEVPGQYVVSVGRKTETMSVVSLGDLRDRFGQRDIVFDGQLRYRRFSLTPITN